ncbi:MAG: DHHW family protein [Lachnospiraceae bacterium]
MRKKVLVILFFIGIFGFSLTSLIKKDRTFSENENRYLANCPKPTIETVFNGKFEKEYETYVTDQFVLRDSMIGLKTYADLCLGKVESNGVYLGKKGYLMEKFDYKTFETELAKENEDALCEFVKDHAELVKEGRLQVLLVPTATQILQDKLPPLAVPYNQHLILERIKDKIPAAFVPVEDSLKMHGKEALFYRTDHHWTTLGAYYGYKAWAKKSGVKPLPTTAFHRKEVTKEFYGTLSSKVNIYLKPDNIQLYYPKEPREYQLDYDLGVSQKKSLYDMEALKKKDKYAVFLGGNYGLVDIKTQVKNGRKLVIIKDSFAHSMVPFLTEHFEELYMVDLRYYNASIKTFIKENKITDILVLYNLSNLATDRTIKRINK